MKKREFNKQAAVVDVPIASVDSSDIGKLVRYYYDGQRIGKLLSLGYKWATIEMIGKKWKTGERAGRARTVEIAVGQIERV